MSETSAAVSAAVGMARDLGLSVDLPQILADRSNLVVHLKPAPVVARVATMTAALRGQPEDWLKREVAIAGFLASKGAAVVPPATEVPPGPHRRDGYLMTFWRWVAEDGSGRPNGEAAGRALRELHAAMASFSGDLPLMGPIVDDTTHMLALLRRGGWPSPVLLDDAQAVLARATGLARDVGGVRPLHGDASSEQPVRHRPGLAVGRFRRCLPGAGGVGSSGAGSFCRSGRSRRRAWLRRRSFGGKSRPLYRGP